MLREDRLAWMAADCAATSGLGLSGVARPAALAAVFVALVGELATQLQDAAAPALSLSQVRP